MPGKNFNDLGYKNGDRVRCVYARSHGLYKVGDILELDDLEGRLLGISEADKAAGNSNYWDGDAGDWELVTDDARAISKAILLLTSKGYTITEPPGRIADNQLSGGTIPTDKIKPATITVDTFTAGFETTAGSAAPDTSKTFKELGYQLNDRVKCVYSMVAISEYFEVGDVIEITERRKATGALYGFNPRNGERTLNGTHGAWELIERAGKPVIGARTVTPAKYEPTFDAILTEHAVYYGEGAPLSAATIWTARDRLKRRAGH